MGPKARGVTKGGRGRGGGGRGAARASRAAAVAAAAAISTGAATGRGRGATTGTRANAARAGRGRGRARGAAVAAAPAPGPPSSPGGFSSSPASSSSLPEITEIGTPKTPKPKRKRSKSPADDLGAARKKVWLADLESIRREKPLVTGKTVITVAALPPPDQKGSNIQKGSKKKDTGDITVISLLSSDSSDPKTPQVITIDDSDSNKGSGGEQGPDIRDRTYYGLQGTSPKEQEALLRYQTGFNPDKEEYPGPSSGLNFDVERARKELKWSAVNQKDIDRVHDVQEFEADVRPQPLELALTKYWLSAGPRLVKGFPMVEDVVFAVMPNYVGGSTNCFFKAMAYFVYGDHEYHDRVKAELLHHFHTVLSKKDHPRHELYQRMNSRFYTTTIGGNGRSRETVANLYQMLIVPMMYTALDMFDITADLYNLFIVVYSTWGDKSVSGVSTMGSYNARHIFIHHANNNHYQPMVPNEYYASEFQLPRITYQSTLGYPLASKKDETKSALQHTWRNRWPVGLLNRSQGALPVDHMYYKQRLANVMKGTKPK